MWEPETLIMSVEKKPCIWDINHSDYHDRNEKDLAWEQICEEVFIDWETCTDKANKCVELKKKWNNIRDYYRKELKKPKKVSTGSAAMKRKKYVYSDLLCFLTPVFSKRHSHENCSNEDSDSSQTILLQSENEGQVIKQEDIDSTESPVPSPPVVNNNQKNNEDVPTQILNMLQQKQTTIVNTDEDDDTKFLLSFRGYMKKMNSNQKLDFQLGMLQLVKKINMRNSSSP